MKNSHPRGFMAIVALGIFALMMIFGLMLQKRTIKTYESIKDGLDYMTAQVIADSVMERLQLELKKHEAGYSLGSAGGGPVICAYGEYAENEGGGQSEICQVFDWMVDQDRNEGVEIRLSIKGRPEVSEKIATAQCGGGLFGAFNDSCYTVPFPGTGDAGTQCELYTPKFSGGAQEGDKIVPVHLANGANNLDQADYACNWNRLTFGSSQTDRVAIPLYYEEGLDQAGAPILISPFFKDTPANKQADKLILRLRTPCLPCVYGDANPEDGISRSCTAGADLSVCGDGERYVLDSGNIPADTKNAIVVQWQLTGKCDDAKGVEQDCAIMPLVNDPTAKSAIYEFDINESRTSPGAKHYKILDRVTKGNDVTVHPIVGVSFLEKSIADEEGFEPKLHLFTQPILNIFLSGKLISTEGRNVPYLEYQLLTNKPMGSPKFKLEADVTVDDNGFTRTIYKEIKKALIDFAIQN